MKAKQHNLTDCRENASSLKKKIINWSYSSYFSFSISHNICYTWWVIKYWCFEIWREWCECSNMYFPASQTSISERIKPCLGNCLHLPDFFFTFSTFVWDCKQFTYKCQHSVNMRQCVRWTSVYCNELKSMFLDRDYLIFRTAILAVHAYVCLLRGKSHWVSWNSLPNVLLGSKSQWMQWGLPSK